MGLIGDLLGLVLSTTSPRPTMVASASVFFRGTIATTVPVPSIVATATTKLTAQGALSAPAPVAALTSTSRLSASLALTAAVPVLAATTALVAQGTVVATSPRPSLAATAGVTLGAAGAVTATAPTCAAQSTSQEWAYVASNVPLPELSTALTTWSPSAALATSGRPECAIVTVTVDAATLAVDTPPVPGLAATGTLTTTGSLAATVEATALGATASMVIGATVAASIASPGMEASALITLTGDSGLAAPPPVAEATADLVLDGASAFSAPPPGVTDSSSVSGLDGRSDTFVEVPSLDAVASMTTTATADLTTPGAGLLAGENTNIGMSHVVSPPAKGAGRADATTAATSTIQTPPSTLDSEAGQTNIATLALTVSAAVLAAQGALLSMAAVVSRSARPMLHAVAEATTTPATLGPMTRPGQSLLHDVVNLLGNNHPVLTFLRYMEQQQGESPGGAGGLPGVLFVSTTPSPSPERNTFKPFPSVAAAYAASEPGDTIFVLPGTYLATEPQVIELVPGHDDLTIEGVGMPVFEGEQALWLVASTGEAAEATTRMRVRNLAFRTSDGAFSVQGFADPDGEFNPLFRRSGGGLVLDNIELLGGAGFGIGNVGRLEMRNVRETTGDSAIVSLQNVVQADLSECFDLQLFVFVDTTVASVSTLGPTRLRASSVRSILLDGCVWLDVDEGTRVRQNVTCDNPLGTINGGDTQPRIHFHGHVQGRVQFDFGEDTTPDCDLRHMVAEQGATVTKDVEGQRLYVNAQGSLVGWFGTLGWAADGPVDIDAMGATYTTLAAGDFTNGATARRIVRYTDLEATLAGTSYDINPPLPADTTYQAFATARATGMVWVPLAGRTEAGFTLAASVASVQADVAITPET